MRFFKKLKIKQLLKKLKKLHAARIEDGKGSVQEEIAICFQIAKLYGKNKKLDPDGTYQLEYYRAAAHLGDPNAQYFCGKQLLDKGRFWQDWASDMLGSKIHEKYAADFFAEALSYITESEMHGHPLAKRLHGLAYIRGWGLQQNNDEGFKLIIASIEQEGAWDRATKIFEDLGLNTPEFFSKLISHRPNL